MLRLASPVERIYKHTRHQLKHLCFIADMLDENKGKYCSFQGFEKKNFWNCWKTIFVFISCSLVFKKLRLRGGGLRNPDSIGQ